MGYTAVGDVRRKRKHTLFKLLQTRWAAMHYNSHPSYVVLPFAFCLEITLHPWLHNTPQISLSAPIHIWKPTVSDFHAELLYLLLYLLVDSSTSQKKKIITLFTSFLFVCKMFHKAFMHHHLIFFSHIHSPFLSNFAQSWSVTRVCSLEAILTGYRLGGIWPYRQWAGRPGFLMELTGWREG